MSRLAIFAPTDADRESRVITDSAIRRLNVSGNANCPIEAAAGFFSLCASQSCGKCTPCRIGLRRLTDDLENILEGKGGEGIVDRLMDTCQALYTTSDCAIGFQAGRIGLAFADLIKEDAESHLERGICQQRFTSVPCVKGCPTHIDIPAYIDLVRAGRYADAVRVIRNDNPFPSACAFVCEHPCEATCRRGMIDAPINIRAIKQHAVLTAGFVPTPAKAPATGKRVAIIGGGPSGLSAAYYLALMGHDVTVFEQNDHLGGMMYYGIPRYRLPAENLDYDIDAILSLGVEVRYNTKVGVTVTWEEVEGSHDCVFVAIGAHHFRDLGIDYATREGVFSAVQFLHRSSSGRPIDMAGKDVVIVGGGNVAMDATRTAKRLGAASVRCVYRRRKKDMTALPEEVNAAVEEGCEIVELMSPVRVDAGTDKPIRLVVQPQMPGLYRGGRPDAKPTSAKETAFECDFLIEAIGQVIEYEYFTSKGLPAERGHFQADEHGRAVGMDKVFVGGDCETGPSTVIRAIDAGKAVAANIDAFLGFHHDVYDEVEIPPVSFDSKLACGRVNIRERSVFDRAHDFDGVEIPLRDEEAEQECSRCLRCDHYGMGTLRGGRPVKW